MAKLGEDQRKLKYHESLASVLNRVPTVTRKGSKVLGELELPLAQIAGVYGLILSFRSPDGQLGPNANQWLQDLAKRVMQEDVEMDRACRERRGTSQSRRDDFENSVKSALGVASQTVKLKCDHKPQALGWMLCCASQFTKEHVPDWPFNVDSLGEHLATSFLAGLPLWSAAEPGELADDPKTSPTKLQLPHQTEDPGDHAVMLCGRLDERVQRTLRAWNQQRVAHSTYPWSLYLLPSLLRDLANDADTVAKAFNLRFYGPRKLTRHKVRMTAATFLHYEKDYAWADLGGIDALEDDPSLSWYRRLRQWELAKGKPKKLKQEANLGNEAKQYVDAIKAYVALHPEGPSPHQVSAALQRLSQMTYPGLDGPGSP